MYSKGVFINNFNEDRFGEDLLKYRKENPPNEKTPPSISHTTYRDPATVPPADLGPAQGDGKNAGAKLYVDRHLLFGHAGDHQPTTMLKHEKLSCSHYFYQAPEKITDPVTSEGFYDCGPALGKTYHGRIAQQKRDEWNYDRDPYKSTYQVELTKGKTEGMAENAGTRHPRVKGEFTKTVDSIMIHRM